MKKILILLLVTISGSLTAQTNQQERTIEVKGISEMEIEPNEIKYTITIEEYWKEEFEKRKEFKDYKTKISLSEIEDALIKDLRKAGIPKNEISVKNMGNYYRYRGKEFLYSKQFVIQVSDFEKINKLAEIVNAKGIKFMNISEVSHSDIETYKKQVKIAALQNAREKARYLVESIGSQLGKVITITEISDGFVRPYRPEVMMARSANAATESIDKVETIKLSYQVKAKFNIQ